MALLAAKQVIGASVEVPRNVGAIPIATSPCWFPLIMQHQRHNYACNCPNNCKHKQGSSCKYYSNPSDKSQVISGNCVCREETVALVKETVWMKSWLVKYL
ncbi:hypothetical protein IFM47457_06772 [Aspergillus lentulus]|nr:hypothetical protein IFM47457_06772 [Aspergillus lentulus]